MASIKLQRILCGRALTEKVFGQALPPARVVERICEDVRTKGRDALFHYTEQFDKVRLDAAAFDVQRRRLAEIPGMVPALRKIPAGCIFAPRCAFAVERCRRERPPLEEHAPGHWSACWEQARVAAGAARD